MIRRILKLMGSHDRPQPYDPDRQVQLGYNTCTSTRAGDYARKDPGETRERNVNPLVERKGLITFHTYMYMCEARSRGLDETTRKMSGVAILRMRRRRLAWAEHGGGGTNRSDLQRAIAAAIYR